jgi:hypothetical protein
MRARVGAVLGVVVAAACGGAREPARPTTPRPVASASAAPVASAKSEPGAMSFDALPAGPTSLVAHPEGASWEIRAATDAPSKPNVLARVGGAGLNIATFLDQPIVAKSSISARCKMLTETVGFGTEAFASCGLSVRNSYNLTSGWGYHFVALVTAGPNAVVWLVRTNQEGSKLLVQQHVGSVALGTWHDIALDDLGDRLDLHWDGVVILSHPLGAEASLPPGRPGVAANGESVFDDVRVTVPDS